MIPLFVVIGPMALLHPAGRGLLARGASYSPALLALVAVAVVPLLAFVANQVALGTSATDPHAVEGHYATMAALATAPLAYGLAAAPGVVGWRLAAWIARPAYLGLLSVAFPARASSVGPAWGAAAVPRAIAFVAVAEYSRATTASDAFRRARPGIARPIRTERRPSDRVVSGSAPVPVLVFGSASLSNPPGRPPDARYRPVKLPDLPVDYPPCTVSWFPTADYGTDTKGGGRGLSRWMLTVDHQRRNDRPEQPVTTDEPDP